MNFKLTTSRYFYIDPDQIKDLEKLGFVFALIYPQNNYRISEASSIEIKSLDELMVFVKEYGDLVVSENAIEIYNDYRE